MTLVELLTRADPPQPWAEGDNIPWHDRQFSERMLAEHLDQGHDLASRMGPTIDAQVEWIDRAILSGRPSRILDLACGPGLYVHGLARRGHQGVGLDFSPASIDHARAIARREALDCRFEHADLRQADFGSGFDLAMLIYGQLNVFTRDQARDILRRAAAAVQPRGVLVLELSEPASLRLDDSPRRTWKTATRGVFCSRPHLLLHERFWDEASCTSTERWHVIDLDTAEVTRHAMSCVAYERESIATMLRAVGLRAIDHPETMLGAPPPPEPSLFTVVARR